jgi:hypothetical protein
LPGTRDPAPDHSHRQRELRFSAEVAAQMRGLADDVGGKGLYGQVLKTIGLLEANPRHPGLHTPEYQSLQGANGERIWEAYVQNRTLGAYRIFFHCGPDELRGKNRTAILTVIAITPHP